MIEKRTPTDFTIIDTIKNRWSPRVFGDLPISKNEIHTLLEAGRWAPSSNNWQPWHIVYGIKGDGVYQRIYDCLAEFNQSWVTNAPVLMMGVINKKNPKGEENFHALHDLGLFMGNVSNQAQHMGIALHQMAGIDYEKALKDFDFPKDFHVATAIAVGYYGGNPSELPEDLEEQEKKRLRERKKQSEFVYNGNFKK